MGKSNKGNRLLGSLQPILKRLKGVPDVDRLAGQGDVEGLLRALEYREDVEVRRAAAEALGRRADRRTRQSLVTALRDPDAKVRAAAALALGKIWDEHLLSLEPLAAALGDKEAAVRQASAEALGECAKCTGSEGDKGRVVQALQPALQDPIPAVRTAAIRLLRNCGPAADESLARALLDGSSEVVAAACAVIDRPGGTSPRLREALAAVIAEEDNAERRELAAYTLAGLGDARAVDPLCAAIRTGRSSKGTLKIVERLGSLGDASAVTCLVALLEKTNRILYSRYPPESSRDSVSDASVYLASEWKAREWKLRHGDALRAVAPEIALRERDAIRRVTGDADIRLHLAAENALFKIGAPALLPFFVAIFREQPRDEQAWILFTWLTSDLEHLVAELKIVGARRYPAVEEDLAALRAVQPPMRELPGPRPLERPMAWESGSEAYTRAWLDRHRSVEFVLSQLAEKGGIPPESRHYRP